MNQADKEYLQKKGLLRKDETAVDWAVFITVRPDTFQGCRKDYFFKRTVFSKSTFPDLL